MEREIKRERERRREREREAERERERQADRQRQTDPATAGRTDRPLDGGREGEGGLSSCSGDLGTCWSLFQGDLETLRPSLCCLELPFSLIIC